MNNTAGTFGASLHRENEFEEDICNHPGAHGWLYEEGDAARYDRKLA
jgi:type I restriction enzyme, R subunit